MYSINSRRFVNLQSILHGTRRGWPGAPMIECLMDQREREKGKAKGDGTEGMQASRGLGVWVWILDIQYTVYSIQ